MNKLQAAQDKFHSTRVEAIHTYKVYKQLEHENSSRKDYYLNLYTKAWQEHQEASMALFLLEAEQ